MNNGNLDKRRKKVNFWKENIRLKNCFIENQNINSKVLIKADFIWRNMEVEDKSTVFVIIKLKDGAQSAWI